MAEAWKCDRCNGYYMINEDIKKRGEYPITAEFKKSIYSFSVYDNNNCRIAHIDLCPECSRSLIAWFKLTTVKQNVAAEETEKAKEKDLTVKLCDICKYKNVLPECNPCRSCGAFNNFEPKEDSE